MKQRVSSAMVVCGVHRRSVVDREVPIVNNSICERLLQRRRDVGRGYVLATPSGMKPEAATVGNAFAYLRGRGFPATTAEALRARWLIDVTSKPVPTAVVARLAGKSMFRTLSKHFDLLDDVTPRDVAELLSLDKDTP